MIGYSGDDMNKFLWMVRIAQGEFADSPREEKFYSTKGGYRWDESISKTMKESLMYKLVYYR